MKKLFSPKELSEYLGLSLNTIYSWVNERKIPHYKVSRLVKFDVIEIDEWLKNKKRDVYEYKRHI